MAAEGIRSGLGTAAPKFTMARSLAAWARRKTRSCTVTGRGARDTRVSRGGSRNTGGWRTKKPERGLASSSPRRSSSWQAFTAVDTLTPCCSLRRRTPGKDVPTG